MWLSHVFKTQSVQPFRLFRLPATATLSRRQTSPYRRRAFRVITWRDYQTRVSYAQRPFRSFRSAVRDSRVGHVSEASVQFDEQSLIDPYLWRAKRAAEKYENRRNEKPLRHTTPTIPVFENPDLNREKNGKHRHDVMSCFTHGHAPSRKSVGFETTLDSYASFVID